MVADKAAVLIKELSSRLSSAPDFQAALDALQAGQAATVDGVWGSSTALVVSALTRRAPTSIFVVLPRERDIDEFNADLTTFGIYTAEGRTPTAAILPAWPALPRELSITDPILGSRLRIVRGFETASPAPVVISTMAALLQPVPSRAERTVASRRIQVGDELDLNELSGWLVERGFERVTGLEMPGEFSIHGGIIDIFPPDSPDPVRIELFGDDVESIRLFDVESQRKVASLTEVVITILTPRVSHSDGDDPNVSPLITSGQHVLDSLSDGAWIVLVEMEECVREGRQYLERLSDPKGLFSVESTMERFASRPHVNLAPLLAGTYAKTCHLQTESIEKFGGAKGQALKELERVVQQDETVLIACHNDAARQRLSELLTEVFADPVSAESHDAGKGTKPAEVAPAQPAGPPLRRFIRGAKAPAPDPLPIVEASPAPDSALKAIENRKLAFQQRVQLCVGHLTRGFRLVAEKIVILSDNELFARTEVQRGPVRKRIESRAIDSFLDLSVGDLVVHLSHGIARFRGMELQSKQDVQEEHLVLEFADSLKMYVPISLIHLVQKYVGLRRNFRRLAERVGPIKRRRWPRLSATWRPTC